MPNKRRIETLQVVVSSHSGLTNSLKLTQITGEFARILAAARVPKHNGWLLTVLHTTRALDTTLSELIKHKGWSTNDTHSLGAYLKVLRTHNVLTNAERNQYQGEVADKRNKYMHEAGAMPQQLEASTILNEMHACLSLVLSRL
jgi:hypothetical protein